MKDNAQCVMTVELKSLPNLFLIGGMRCGSTSLHLLLDQHPNIYMSPVKEPYFYVAETMRREIVKSNIPDPQLVHRLNSYVEKGKYRTVDSYQSLFEKAENEKYLGESSLYYIHSQVARVIKEDSPKAKIIVSIRNPAERMFSNYMYLRREGKTEKTFPEFVYDKCEFDQSGRLVEVKIGRSKLTKGFYYRFLKEWVDVFGHDQIYIILYEEFKRDPIGVCQSVFNWLGIDSSFEPTPIHAQKSGIPKRKKIFDYVNRQGLVRSGLKRLLPKVARVRLRAVWYRFFLEREKMNLQEREFLKDVYRSDIECMEREFDLDLSDWK